jgi:hypothetical protein
MKCYNLECAIGHGLNIDSEEWFIEDYYIPLGLAELYKNEIDKLYDSVNNWGWKARIVECPPNKSGIGIN